MKNKLIKFLISVGPAVFILFGMLTAQASGTAKVLQQSQFKSEYLELCLSMKGLKELPQKKRSKYCECMLNQYQKRNYTTAEDLKVVRKMYSDQPQSQKKLQSEKESLFEETLNAFEQDAAEECLS